MKKKKGYLSGAGALAAAVVFAKVLGAAYRIPLANLLGAEGMGLYQFVYPVFALLLTLSGGSVPTAVSISVSELVARGEEEEARKFFFRRVETEPAHRPYGEFITRRFGLSCFLPAIERCVFGISGHIARRFDRDARERLSRMVHRS